MKKCWLTAGLCCVVFAAGYADHAALVQGPLADKTLEDVPALIEALEAPEMGTRWNAALLLGELGAKAAVPALLARVEKDENARVRRRAIEALGKLRDVSAVPVLLQALKDSDRFVRRDAVRALGNLGDQSVIPAVLALLKDPEGFVRRDAALVLGELGDPSVLADLQTAAQESPAAYSRDAALASAEMSPVAREALFAIGKLGGEEAVSALEKILQHPKSPKPVRTRVVAQLGALGAPALPSLTAALADSELEVRAAVIQELTRIGAPAGLPGLFEALKSEDQNTIRETAKALAELGDKSAIPLLRETAKRVKEQDPKSRLPAFLLKVTQFIESPSSATP